MRQPDALRTLGEWVGALTRSVACAVCVGAILPGAWAQAPDSVARRVVRAERLAGPDLLVNAGFEAADAAAPQAWQPWGLGYEPEQTQVHSGRRAVTCASVEADEERGVGQTVELNQPAPRPIVASGWSKAVDVSPGPASGYSIYLDIIFTDDTPLWGQIAAFSTGTHDWQRRQVVLVPEKPIRSVTMHALFRGHTGTVYFDDLSLREIPTDEGAVLFERCAVEKGRRAVGAVRGEAMGFSTEDGLSITLDSATGQITEARAGAAAAKRLGGFYVRDVGADSDFVWLRGSCAPDGGLQLESPELRLRLEGQIAAHPNHLDIEATLTDQTGQDRALTLYFALPFDARGATWWDDATAARPAAPPATFLNTRHSGAGATGTHSIYPFGALTAGATGVAMATPLNPPRHYRIGYDPKEEELFIAWDLGLSPKTKRLPSRATVRASLYAFAPKWGFRAALQSYYALFPDFFVKRVPREGVWMPFTDIATVERPESFHFAFKEGNDNVAWDEQHDVLTFVYTEPMTNWQTMSEETPRTYEAALETLKANLSSPNPHVAGQSGATMTSAATDAGGRTRVAITDAPWCDGGVFTLNPDPDVPPTDDHPVNQAQFERSKLRAAFDRARHDVLAGWRHFGEGFAVDGTEKRDGERSIRCDNSGAAATGASQTVVLNQQQPADLVVRGASKCENVPGEPDVDYSLYVDLTYTDGTNLWAQVAEFPTGTHDWEVRERIIRPEKPVRSAVIHCLLRRGKTGTAWFDDVFFGPAGTEDNLLTAGDFEGADVQQAELDGVYIDSSEGWGTQINYREEHFAGADVPLVFSPDDARLGILTQFSTFEFVQAVEREMRQNDNLMMANSTPRNWNVLMPLLDVIGTETNWHRDKQWRPDSVATFNVWRALCRQRPYCLLMNTRFEDWTRGLTDKYMRRCLHWGVYPGFFSENAATNVYFGNPAWYNRDRALFEKYLPLIIRLGRAGWEPITHATAEPSSVLVERYGGLANGSLHFTVFNPTQQQLRYTLRLESGPLRLPQAPVAEEHLSGRSAAPQRDGQTWALTGELGPEEVELWSVTP